MRAYLNEFVFSRRVIKLIIASWPVICWCCEGFNPIGWSKHLFENPFKKYYLNKLALSFDNSSLFRYDFVLKKFQWKSLTPPEVPFMNMSKHRKGFRCNKQMPRIGTLFWTWTFDFLNRSNLFIYQQITKYLYIHNSWDGLSAWASGAGFSCHTSFLESDLQLVISKSPSWRQTRSKCLITWQAQIAFIE